MTSTCVLGSCLWTCSRCLCTLLRFLLKCISPRFMTGIDVCVYTIIMNNYSNIIKVSSKVAFRLKSLDTNDRHLNSVNVAHGYEWMGRTCTLYTKTTYRQTNGWTDGHIFRFVTSTQTLNNFIIFTLHSFLFYIHLWQKLFTNFKFVFTINYYVFLFFLYLHYQTFKPHT